MKWVELLREAAQEGLNELGANDVRALSEGDLNIKLKRGRTSVGTISLFLKDDTTMKVKFEMNWDFLASLDRGIRTIAYVIGEEDDVVREDSMYFKGKRITQTQLIRTTYNPHDPSFVDQFQKDLRICLTAHIEGVEDQDATAT